MAIVTLTAEVSERNSKGDQKKVIRVLLEGKQVFTRTLVMSQFGSSIERMRDGFKAAEDRGLTLEHDMKCEIRRFADTFGRPGSFFRSYASRTRNVYVRINRRNPRTGVYHNERSDTADLLAAGFAGFVIGVLLDS